MAARDPQVSSTNSARRDAGLALGALGVVYGDLGTNPLFALADAFGGEHPIRQDALSVLGVLSLVFWALTLVVTLKYITFVMRASNQGEGGILALLGLIPETARPHLLVLVILFGSSLLYGDGVVTPAISVLSAVEGLKAVTSVLVPFIVPITIAILIGLFLLQKHGTHRIGGMFGPIMVVWFVAIGALGTVQILRVPGILAAITPVHMVRFFAAAPGAAFRSLGAVILCIAGGEALYADMGHFGRRPIALAWYVFVFPALILNYFGQGAFLLSGGSPQPSTFYAIVPHLLLIPMIALSTVATVIASQALISGAYSLTHQAVQLGMCPRVTVVHTSAGHEGQIYVPEVNRALMVLCILLVATFRTSDSLAAAYGLAVTGTMAVTTLAWFVVLTKTWRWPLLRALPVALFFFSIDITFLVANLRKFWDGGWVPVTIGLGVFTLFTTWMTGRKRLASRLAANLLPMDMLLEDIARRPPPRVRGMGVFLTANTGGVPVLLLHHFKHNQVLHERVVLVTVQGTQTPYVERDRQVELVDLGQGFSRLVARTGFMEKLELPEVLSRVMRAEVNRTSYYMGRETIICSRARGMAHWRKVLFAFISRNAVSAAAYFGIPPNRVIELGMQVEL
jgi:KUP system potassium uptake protein